MKVKIDTDEWYPVFTISRDVERSYGYVTEIDDELFKRYEAAFAEWDAVQDELRKLMGGV